MSLGLTALTDDELLVVTIAVERLSALVSPDSTERRGLAKLERMLVSEAAR